MHSHNPEEGVHFLGAEEAAVAGDGRRTSWVTSRRGPVSLGLCGGRSLGDRRCRPEERSFCRVAPFILSVPQAGGCLGQGLGRGVLALRGVQLEASVVQFFLEACEEGPCGIAGGRSRCRRRGKRPPCPMD